MNGPCYGVRWVVNNRWAITATDGIRRQLNVISGRDIDIVPPTVAIIGGGIAGLTVAHELASRGVEVELFEASGHLGGKAHSFPAAEYLGHSTPFHGEHGFRFLPAFYRHLPDTMSRIPTMDSRTVADHLIETQQTLLAHRGKPNRAVTVGRPRTLGDWMDALDAPLADDLPLRERRHLLERLLYILTSCERRRQYELDAISWPSFLDIDRRSRTFRERIEHMTQALVALRANRASAKTMGTIYLQLLFGQIDPTRPTERILDGPTSPTFVDPWRSHLENLGVDIHTGSPVTDIAFDAPRGRIDHVRAETGSVEADQYVLAVPLEVARYLLPEEIRGHDPTLRGIDRLETAWMAGLQCFLEEDITLTTGHAILADAPWKLTAISQRQFWHTTPPADDQIQGVLSVIISDWQTPGIDIDRPASACSLDEIEAEVLTQLTLHLDAEGFDQDRVVDVVIDPAISPTADGDGVENRTPLFVNTVGSYLDRPRAETRVDNLTLAGDYVRTSTDLASMESANEAGRRAATAILGRLDVPGRPVDIWQLDEPTVFAPWRRFDRWRFERGLPHAADTISRMIPI